MIQIFLGHKEIVQFGCSTNYFASHTLLSFKVPEQILSAKIRKLSRAQLAVDHALKV